MAMPEGDSPQVVRDYYLYLQGHQLAEHLVVVVGLLDRVGALEPRLQVSDQAGDRLIDLESQLRMDLRNLGVLVPIAV